MNIGAMILGSLIEVEMDLKVRVLGQRIQITGPTDSDSDGDPEFTARLNDAPPTKIEIPVSIVVKGIPAIVAFVAAKMGLSK